MNRNEKEGRTLPPWDSTERDAARPQWKALDCQVVFENPWLRVETSAAISPTGSRHTYGVVRFRNHAVGVLPVHDDGTVVLVGQHRFPHDAYSWEMPEGGVPEGELPIDGAIRELREETGLVAQSLDMVLRMDLTNSVADEMATCYLATGLSQLEAEPDEMEQFEYARVPFKTVLQSVINGDIRDAMTVATVLRVHHMAVTGTLSSPLCERLLA